MEKLIAFFFLTLYIAGCAQTSKRSEGLTYKQKEYLFAVQNETALLKELKDPFYKNIAKGKCLSDWNGYVKKQKKLLTKYKSNENRSKVWSQLGSCYVFIGEYKNAFYYYDLALSFAGNQIELKSRLLSNIGMVYEKIGLPTMAESYFQKSLLAYPNNVFSSFKLGVSHLRMGDFRKSTSIFKNLIKRYPRSGVLYSALGVSFALSGDIDSLRNKVFPFYNEKDIEKVLFKISIKVMSGKLSKDDFSDLKDLELEKEILKNFQSFLIKETGRKNGKEKI